MFFLLLLLHFPLNISLHMTCWNPFYYCIWKKKSIIFSNKSPCSIRKKREEGCLSRGLFTHHCPWQLPPGPRVRLRGYGEVGTFNTLSFGPEILKHYHEDTSSGEISWKLRNSISILLGTFTVRVYSQNPWVLRKGTNLSYHDYSLIMETINKLGIKLQWVLRAQTWLEFQLQCSLAGWTDSLPISSSVKWGQQGPLPFTVIVRFKKREYENA